MLNVWYFIGGMLFVFWLFCNGVVLYQMTAKEMRYDFVIQQHWLFAIFACVFYSLAWIIKGLQWALNRISRYTDTDNDND